MRFGWTLQSLNGDGSTSAVGATILAKKAFISDGPDQVHMDFPILGVAGKQVAYLAFCYKEPMGDVRGFKVFGVWRVDITADKPPTIEKITRLTPPWEGDARIFSDNYGKLGPQPWWDGIWKDTPRPPIPGSTSTTLPAAQPTNQPAVSPSAQP